LEDSRTSRRSLGRHPQPTWRGQGVSIALILEQPALAITAMRRDLKEAVTVYIEGLSL
jgi:hypothetical protein